MTSASQMLGMILGFAENDARVRAVMLNGSRANPNVTPDIFGDFDIVYLVSELESFKRQPTWIDCFGERMILQLPNDFGANSPTDSYAYLIQLTDGNRIDLTLKTRAFTPDSLSVLLLDKDRNQPSLPAPSEQDYLPVPPTQKAYFEGCNEFWWVAPYVAKGLWRKEIIHAQQHLEILRRQLLQMLEWQLGIQTGFCVPLGKSGKYYRQHMGQAAWELLLETYSSASVKNIWSALLAACRLFRTTALNVARAFEFAYPMQDDSRITAYLRHIRELPDNAQAIY